MADVTKIFKPRRGKSGTMASGAKAATVLQAGELFVELPSGGANTGDGHCKIKIGDGATAYSSLKYAIGDTANDKVLVDNNTSTTITSALNSATSDQPLKTVLGGLKRAINLCDTNINEMSGNLGIEITQAAYNALGNTVLTDNKTYFVSDAAGYDEMASQVSTLNSNFAYDENGIYGYHRKVDGADTVIPFKSDNSFTLGAFSYDADNNIISSTDKVRNDTHTFHWEGKTIKRVIGEFSAYYFSANCSIQTSLDGVNWTTIDSYSQGETGTSGGKSFDKTLASGINYIRINASGTNGDTHLYTIYFE